MHAEFRSLEALTARLPFHLDDTDQVNAAFTRWRRAPSDQDKFLVDLWTYCFVRRYYLGKFVREPTYSAADLEKLIDRTYQKVERNHATVRNPACYASWVATICKNTFINYLRARRTTLPLEQLMQSGFEVATDGYLDTSRWLLETLHRAIEQLPPFLREVIRLRIVEDFSYEQLHERTGKSVPTLRAYVNRALKHLRQDEQLRDLYEQHLLNQTPPRRRSPSGKESGS